MLDSYFSINQQFQLAVSFLLIILSIISFEWLQKEKLSVLLLLAGIVCYKTFIILLDPYLHVWDEQFHALVAKNLSTDFLTPKLIPEPILPYDYKAWVANYIWVHKQPMFLWQMALSLKLFGVNIFALRLPSLICSSLTVLFIYKTGRNFFNSRIGFYGALFYGANYYFNEVLAAYYATDHNDTAFLFYVTASIWALSEHITKPQEKKWIILIGLLSGCAILTKWLVGLLVYAGWFFYTAINLKKSFYKLSNYSSHFISLLITLMVALPWQLYILWRFPKESRYEYAYNAKHLHEVVEGHSGTNWYYIDCLAENIGYLAPFFVLLGLYFLYFKAKKTDIYLTVLLFILLVFSFFSYAATKMPAFTFVVYSFLFLGFGAIADKVADFINYRKLFLLKLIYIGLIFFTFYSLTGLEKIQELHTSWKKNIPQRNNRYSMNELKKTGEYIDSLHLDKNYVLFNCSDYWEVPLMFYTNHLAYWGIPNDFQMQLVKSKNKKIALINNGNLPEALLTRKDLLIITPPQLKVKLISKGLLVCDKQFITCSKEPNVLLSENRASAQVEIIEYENGTCKIRCCEQLFLKWNPNNNSVYCATQNQIHEERFIAEKLFGNLFELKTIYYDPINYTVGKNKPKSIRLYKLTGK